MKTESRPYASVIPRTGSHPGTVGRLYGAMICAALLAPACSDKSGTSGDTATSQEKPSATAQGAGSPANAGTAAATPAPVAARPSVAVLPFLGADGKPGWLGMAVADNLTTRLLVQSQMDSATQQSVVPLYVFSWRQSMSAARSEGIQLADLGKRAPDLLTQLGADYLLTGSYASKDKKVTFTWQLVAAGGGKEHQVETDEAGLSQASYDIAKAVLGELAPTFDASIGGNAFQALAPAALKQYGEAIEILAGQSLDPRAQVVLAPASLERAKKLLSAVIEAAPTFSRAWTERGVVAAMMQDFKGAEESLVQGTALKDDPEPSTALGIFYMYDRQQQPALAIKALEDTTATYLGSLQALGYLGDAYLREHRNDDALRVFTTYAARVPKSPWVQLRRASALSRLGQHEAAIRDTEALAAKLPNSVAVLLALASRQIDAGKFDAARATITRGLELSPNHPALLTRLSYIELDANNPAEALKLAEKAVAQLGDGRGETLAGYAHIDMAHALALLGRNDDAYAALRKAMELGIGPDEMDRLARDPKLQAFLADPRCPIPVKASPAQPKK